VIRPGPRWAVLAFPLVALLLCWEAFRPGYVLLPTALESVPPWSESTGVPGGRTSNPLMNDSLLLTLPARLYNHRMLRQGELPFWNPHVFCGYPHLALIQNHALYPPTLPFDLVEPVAGIGYATCLHLALAGLLMYAFLRRSGLGREAALVGGLVFELNGMFLVRLGAPSYVYSGTWLPLMLLGARALLDGQRGRACWALPAGVALSVLGGHPQITMLAVLLTVAYVLWHALARPTGTAGVPGRGWLLGALGLLIVVGMALSGYQLVPFLELVAHSARDAVPLEVYRNSATPPLALVQALVPDAFGNPVDGTYWLDRVAHLLDGVSAERRYWGFNYTGQNVFTGVAPLVLALFAVRTRRTDVAFFGLGALASLAVLLGTPLLDLAWATLPGFRYSRPDRIVYAYLAALSVLAAHGYEAASEHPPDAIAPRARLAARVVAILLAALLAWTALAPLFQPERRAGLVRAWAEAAQAWGAQPRVLGQAAAAAAIAAGTVLLMRRRRAGRGWSVAWAAALVALPNLDFGWRYNPAQPQPRLGGTPTETLLLARTGPTRFARILTGQPLFLPPNLAQLLALDDVQGASAAGLEPYLRLVHAADAGAVVGGKYFLSFRDSRVASTPLLKMLGVEWVASDALLPLPRTPAAAGAVALFRNPGFLPRFYLVPRVEAYDDVRRARERLLSPAFDPETSALVPARQASALGTLAGPPGAAPGQALAASVRRQAPHHIELDVDAPWGGVLVTSEAAYPGWESRLDGRPVETLLVNTAFRGLAVPPGPHRITMSYGPRSFRAGLALTLAGVLAALAAWARLR
jgi:hypothetical protein